MSPRVYTYPALGLLTHSFLQVAKGEMHERVSKREEGERCRKLLGR
jgi:hypothetical protein